MANILLSLVGDQTVPNVFLIRDRAFRHISRYIFITTPLMEKRRRLAHILAATGIGEGQYKAVSVAADNVADIRLQLGGLQLPRTGNHYYVNLTSGTKLMSIALYDYFTREGYQACSSIFYIPIGKNAYLQVFPEEVQREEPLSYRITLREYLSSYGIEVLEEKGESQLHRPAAYTASVLPRFQAAMAGKPFADMMKNLRNHYRKLQQRADFTLEAGPKLASFLRDIDFPLPPNGRLDKAAVAYLIGGWFEEWAFLHLREALTLPEAAIRFGVKVSRPNAEGAPVANECDVMFTHNNTLYIVECKTGIRSKQQFEESAYKLATLRSEFGQRVWALFLTPSSLRDTRGRLRRPYLNRARMHRIHLFDREGLGEELAAFLEELG